MPRYPFAEAPQPSACCALSLAFEATIVFEPSTLTWPSRARNVSITAPAVGSRTIVAPLPSNETVSIASVRSTNDAQLILPRSEEHTSEIHSLKRYTYAVICLYKKYHKSIHYRIT